MSLVGTLNTMPLADLLQWVGGSRRTGTLHVELDKVVKEIYFRDGEIVGCSTDDPPEFLGQFLIGRGRITEQQMLDGLARQEASGRHLGALLVESGAIAAEELSSHLTAKAEETILSLFDWAAARFRFQDGEVPATLVFTVSLRVEEVLLRGVQRFDEMQRIRQVLSDPALVLRPTANAPPEGVLDDPAARSVYLATDGERTLADVRLHVRGSEYFVYRCLFELLRSGHLAISGKKRAGQPTSGQARGSMPEREVAEPVNTDRSAPDVDKRLQRARRAMAGGDPETALAILDGLYEELPGDEALRRLTLETEAAFVEKAYRHYLPARLVVHLARPIEELATRPFSPTEFFLISRIDGAWDVKSIVQLAPLREADTLRTLKRLRESGVIELRDPRRAG
jgi:Domain of unknown function (DUF4388)